MKDGGAGGQDLHCYGDLYRRGAYRPAVFADLAGNASEKVDYRQDDAEARHLPGRWINSVCGCCSVRSVHYRSKLDEYGTTYTLKSSHNKAAPVYVYRKCAIRLLHLMSPILISRTRSSTTISTLSTAQTRREYSHKTVVFSVNRFGSGIFDDSTVTYAEVRQEARQVVIRETNVSGLMITRRYRQPDQEFTCPAADNRSIPGTTARTRAGR